MNSDRRKRIRDIALQVGAISRMLGEVRQEIDNVRSDEQDAYDDLSEGHQQGDRGQAMEAAIASLDMALDGIDEIDTENIVRALEEAADRDLGAEGRQRKLSEAEVKERALARLPGWAKELLAGFDRKLADLKAQLDASMPDPTGKIEEAVVSDYISPLNGKVLPTERIRFPALGIEIHADKHREALEIRTYDMGVLTVLPSASNEVYVRARKLSE